MRFAVGLGCCLLLPCGLFGQGGSGPVAGSQTYFEFGTVVALQPRSLELETVEEGTQRRVRHTFALTAETQADLVRVGDAVEAVYSVDAAGSSRQWTLRRLVSFQAGIPQPGPPPRGNGPAGAPAARAGGAAQNSARGGSVSATVQAPAQGATAAQAGSAPIVRSAPNPSSAGTPTAAKKAARPPAKPSQADATAKNTVPPVPGQAQATNTPATALPARLAGPAAPRIAVVPTGAPPSEECHRSDPDWPSEPLSIAVLDFRYPTEREEAHDVGGVGGGSGTALADIVFARLGQDDQFAFIRGDRRRIFREDFAGAARVGRQLGADAVFAGTFEPVQHTDADGFPLPVTWKLRAGVVDTCTGQLLMKLTSDDCPSGSAAACASRTVSEAEAADPPAYAGAFRPLLDPLLLPLERRGASGQRGSAGMVTSVAKGEVTLTLAAGSGMRAGDQVEIRASRLLKNNSTYTLQSLQDRAIGRVTVTSVHGRSATGQFTGDYTPAPGDTVQPLTP